jgi:hypothetical protein
MGVSFVALALLVFPVCVRVALRGLFGPGVAPAAIAEE